MEEYGKRLIDDNISIYMQVAKAIHITGVEGCGKTSSALQYIADSAMKPELVDEWQEEPQLWDNVKMECDSSSRRGRFILTSSREVDKDNAPLHSGIGRIVELPMSTMTLWEKSVSTDLISLEDMVNGMDVFSCSEELDEQSLVELILTGGFPEDIGLSLEDIGKKALLRLESYLDGCRLDLEDRECIDRLYSRRAVWLDNQDLVHFSDISLLAAAKGQTVQSLLEDRFMLEMLFREFVLHELKAYMDYYRGDLYYFRDSTTQEEVDAIVEFRDGEYGAIEIKLGPNQIDEAKESLMAFYENVQRKPVFMCVIVGFYPAVIRDPETGIYIVPISALGVHRNH